MARVYTFAELRTKLKYSRDLINSMLGELRSIERYRNLQVLSDTEQYVSLVTALDAKIAALDYQRDDVVGQLNDLTLTLWDRTVDIITTSGGANITSIAFTITTSNTLTFTNGDLTGVFAVSDVIEIFSAENPDHNGFYTVATFPGLTMTLTPTPTTGDAMAVSSLTRSSTTATCNTTAVHGLTTGDYVVVAGAVESAYNGTFQVTVVDTDTFTYTVSGSPSTPATGTITVTKAAASNSADTAMKIRLYAR